LLDVLGHDPGANLDRLLAWVADQLADPLVGVVAGHHDQLERVQRFRLVARESLESSLHVVAQLRPQRRGQRLDQVGPGGQHEAQSVIVDDLGGRGHAVGSRDEVVGDRRQRRSMLLGQLAHVGTC